MTQSRPRIGFNRWADFSTFFIISRQWSQAVLPFDSVDLDVLFMSSSVVHLAPHAVADGPEDSYNHSKEAGHDHDVGRDEPPGVPVLCLQGHQVGPAAGEHKSHRGHDHVGHGPQLLLHVHGHSHSLVASLSDSPVAFFPFFLCPSDGEKSLPKSWWHWNQAGLKESCGLISLSTCSCDNFYSCLNINKSSYQVWGRTNAAAVEGVCESVKMSLPPQT